MGEPAEQTTAEEQTSEETTEETAQEATEETPEANAEEQTEEATEEDVPEDAGDAARRALQAERNARKAARRELRETREKLTEAEGKLAELADAPEKIAALEAEVMRYKVAADKGLPPKLAARLTGTTEDELRADADDLLSLVLPEADFDGGPRKPPPAPKETDPAKAHNAFLSKLLSGEDPDTD